jgi:predicted esterase
MHAPLNCADPPQPPQWEPAPSSLPADQELASQSEGWDESLRALRAALAQHAPVDAVLGFSQGAAVAAVLCAMQQQEQQEQQQDKGPPPQTPAAAAAAAATGPPPPPHPPLRFAILLSGFPSPSPAHAALLAAAGPLRLPSLHVFGAAGADRAVAARLSEALADAFDPAAGRRLARRGGGGHGVPRTRALVGAVQEFVRGCAPAAGGSG